jgi:hypothetical protein
VVEILAEGATGGAPSRTELDAWIQAYSIPVTTVRDPDGAPLASHAALGIRETAFLVDLSTMLIVQVVNGSLAGIGDSSVKQAVPMILSLLGAKGG